jgi:Na+/proline symporter
MRTRFGHSRGAELAYISVVVYALVSVIPFLTMAFKGIGKFAESFVPIETLGLSAASLPWGMSTADFYAIIIMSVTGLYCIVGGMYSVVMNDLIQFGLIVVAAVIIGIVAIVRTTPEQIAAAVPANWDQMFFGWRLDIDWSNLISRLNEKLYNPVSAGGDGYSIFGLFILMIFLKGVLVSMAGPTPNYAIQHVLSTRSPREAALENLMMGIAFGFATKSVHSNTELLVSAIIPAFVIPNVIKWHWWRFNGYGFFAGMVAGTLSALALLFVGKADYMKLLGMEPVYLHPIYVLFPTIMTLSAVASIGVCLLTRPEEDEILKSFYRTVRPWGFWKPIYEKCRADDPAIEPNRDFWRDWFNIVVGLVWEMSMVAMPIFLVIQQPRKMWLCAAVFAVTSAILKFTWYDKLEPAVSQVLQTGKVTKVAPGPAAP